MWKIEIVKVTKSEIIGTDTTKFFQVTVSDEKLPAGTKLKKGDLVEGYKAGGTFYAMSILDNPK